MHLTFPRNNKIQQSDNSPTTLYDIFMVAQCALIVCTQHLLHRGPSDTCLHSPNVDVLPYEHPRFHPEAFERLE